MTLHSVIAPIIQVIVIVTLSVSSTIASEKQYTPGFDCNKATSKIEKTICSEEKLAAADGRLNRQYQQLVSSMPASDADQFKKDQRAWLTSRDDSCGRTKYIAECLKDAYDQRITLFENWSLSVRTNRFREDYILDKDPSTIPLKKIPEEPSRSRERYRLVADFNNDGIDDVALSYNTSMFGNAGGDFFLYLGQSDGTYKGIGSFFAHPAAINLKKPKKGEGFVTIYSRSNAGSGLIVEKRITRAGVFFVNKKSIQPGAGGVPADQKLYADLFGLARGLKAEISETNHNIVHWMPNKTE